MLVAVTDEGRKVVASSGARQDGPRCPACGQHMIVRIPSRRVPHFAHRPHAGCTGKQTRPRARRHASQAGQDELTLFDLDVTEPG